MESGRIQQHLASERAVYPLPLSHGAPGDGKAREAPQAARARIEQLGGMPSRLDVVLHSEIDAHKKTSHFSDTRNGRQFKNEAGLFLSSGRGGFARQRVVTVLPKCGPRACHG